MGAQRLWVRIILVVLAVQNLVTGVWAVLAPRSFYDGFPGLGRHWVSANPPFNQHLIGDAGAGFLAVGVVLAVAALWQHREVVRVALIAFLVNDIPHFLYHVMHPADALGSTDKMLSTGGLGLLAVLALIALIASYRTDGSARR